MLGENTILVVDDNSKTQHDISVILRFLNEPVSTHTFLQWRQLQETLSGKSEEITCIVFGEAHERFDLINEIKRIKEKLPFTPIIFLGEKNLEWPEDLDPHIKRRVIAQLNNPPAYNPWVDALHRAQRFREATMAASRNNEKRPVHLFRSLVGTSRE
ncbi:MAG: hypothetical protein RL497_2911, partial [Pseudomonadota bacterium]